MYIVDLIHIPHLPLCNPLSKTNNPIPLRTLSVVWKMPHALSKARSKRVEVPAGNRWRAKILLVSRYRLKDAFEMLIRLVDYAKTTGGPGSQSHKPVQDPTI